MDNTGTSSRLLDLLNEAIARELQVCIQYMFQHSIGAREGPVVSGRGMSARQSKFIVSHSPVWLPGTSLRKTAITEMQHAEAITERVAVLGGEPTTQPNAITIGNSIEEMLQNDREQERGAIQLYRQVIAVATEENDDATRGLFEHILSDEERHYRLFSDLLGEH